MFYKQCDLMRDKGNGYVELDTAWIPEKFAVKDKILRIRNEEGWKVVKVWGRGHEDHLIQNERNYLHQREVSDV